MNYEFQITGRIFHKEVWLYIFSEEIIHYIEHFGKFTVGQIEYYNFPWVVGISILTL